MARAKRTERADARRRYRAQQVELATQEPAAGDDGDDAATRQPASLASNLRSSASRLRLPDFAGDARTFVPLTRAKPLLLAPYALLLVGAVTALLAPSNSNALIGYLVSFTLVQPTLLFFAVGFLAPRAAYLHGAVLGLFAGILYVVVVVAHVAVLGDTAVAGSISGLSVAFYVVTDVASGAIFAWFASWYRDFLRRTQERSREAAEKRKREQARQARTKAATTRRPAR